MVYIRSLASASSSACLRMKFWSRGSSSSATSLTARSSRFICQGTGV